MASSSSFSKKSSNVRQDQALSAPLLDIIAASPSQLQDQVLALFPDLRPDELGVVDSLKVGIRLMRNNSALVKYVTWNRRQSPQQKIDTTELARLQQTIASTATMMGWDIQTLTLIPSEVKKNWDLAVAAPGYDAWHQAKSSASLQTMPRSIPTIPYNPDAPSNRSFFLHVGVAVVNPDNDDVWEVADPQGCPVEFPNDYNTMSDAQKAFWWNSYIEDHRQELEDHFKITDVPKLFRPRLRLLWNVASPDGAWARPLKSDVVFDDQHRLIRNPARPTTPWNKTSACLMWNKVQLDRLEASERALVSWVAHTIACDPHQKRPWKDGGLANGSKIEWDILDQKPLRNARDFDDMMKDMVAHNPSRASKMITQVMEQALAICLAPPTKASSPLWENVPALREVFLDRPWMTSMKASKEWEHWWLDTEQSHFNKMLAAINDRGSLEEYVDSLSPLERSVFSELMYWNAPEQSSEELEKIMFGEPPQDPSLSSVTSPEVPQAKRALSTTDWTPLLDAFEIERDTLSQEPFAHPFEKWMARLSPPKVVEEATIRWLEDNDKFNEINRTILRKKDAADAALHADLVAKLNNVIEVSNEVVAESALSGGWWGRVKKSLTSGHQEAWADAFLDFQNHMVKMFGTINSQIERDRIWLSFADRIATSADNVDKMWSSWLSDTARQLQDERAKEGDQASPEQKIDWNNRVDLLESAQTAQDHIKTATSITNVLLEKVRQSTTVKEKLQQRAMMFYWSNLNMFAGLQSLQRNTNGIMEQSEMVEAMAQSLSTMATRSLKDEMEQKEKIRAAFSKMSESEHGMKQFYDTIAAFQKDTIAILSDFQETRDELQIETIDASHVAKERAQQRKSKTISTGPK